VATLCVYGVQKCGYSKVRKRREGRAQYEPIRKVNRYKQNCPVQDNLDNKGMTKWNCEKVPFCTVHNLKVYLINSITTANTARSKKSVVTSLVNYNMSSGKSCWLFKGTIS